MDFDSVAALTGLLRAARAVEEELDVIRQANPRDGFPHDRLVDALPAAGALYEATLQFAMDLEAMEPERRAQTFVNSARILGSLHGAAQRLRAAVEWSSHFTAVDWWVDRRTAELGFPDKLVLIAPLKLGEFAIERASRFREVLIELTGGGLVLSGADGGVPEVFAASINKLARIHLLRVPPSDGIAPSWHPVLLGHELAHLRYSHPRIRQWLAELGTAGRSDLVVTAINDARRLLEGGQVVGRSQWLTQLEHWLAEVACDSTAAALYGDAGIAAMRSVLVSHSLAGASPTHPRPDLRLAIQAADAVGDLDSFVVEDDFDTAESRCTGALIQLALELRDFVCGDIAAQVPLDLQMVKTIEERTCAALQAGVVPSSSGWPAGNVTANASSIESGMVRGLWKRFGDHADHFVASHAKWAQDIRFVSQAIDALEFAARFDEKRAANNVEDPPIRMPLPNVLWLSDAGVRTHPEDDTGVHAYDLRLGRHFIVFQRSAVSELSALGANDLRSLQREVQVGWGDEFVLHPSELVLAVTFESIELDDSCFAQVLSRSSLGRLGLLSATAVLVQPGFRGCLTLELVNLANVPLLLTPGQRVAQIVPTRVAGEARPYMGGYQDSGAKPEFSLSRADWDAELLQSMGQQPASPLM